MNFQSVLAGLPDAVIAVDDALRVVFWNAAAEVLVERSARRAEGRLLKEIFVADASLVRRLSETLTTGESRSGPHSCQSPSPCPYEVPSLWAMKPQAASSEARSVSARRADFDPLKIPRSS